MLCHRKLPTQQSHRSTGSPPDSSITHCTVETNIIRIHKNTKGYDTSYFQCCCYITCSICCRLRSNPWPSQQPSSELFPSPLRLRSISSSSTCSTPPQIIGHEWVNAATWPLVCQILPTYWLVYLPAYILSWPTYLQCTAVGGIFEPSLYNHAVALKISPDTSGFSPKPVKHY